MGELDAKLPYCRGSPRAASRSLPSSATCLPGHRSNARPRSCCSSPPAPRRRSRRDRTASARRRAGGSLQLPVGTAVVRKIRSPQITGLECPRPGNLDLPRDVDVSLHWSARHPAPRRSAGRRANGPTIRRLVNGFVVQRETRGTAARLLPKMRPRCRRSARLNYAMSCGPLYSHLGPGTTIRRWRSATRG